MAKERNSRSFDLDKGGKHSFDLEKKSTRNFDLKKDDSENVAASTDTRNQTSSAPPVSQTDNGGDNGNSDRKKWLWVLLCFVVLAILAYLFIPEGQGVQEKSDVDTTKTVKDDSIQNKSNTGNIDESSVFSSDVQPASSSAASSDVSNDNSLQSQPSTSPAPTIQQSERVQSADVAVESSSESVDEQAQQVIRGVYGNNPERRRKLGTEYKKIQKRVNELMRK